MLRSIKALRGYSILASDGEIGKVDDFYFHDDTWVIRYVVVDTGHWLPGRKVLLAPSVLGQPNWAEENFPVALTRDQVRHSPETDTNKPVSRQHEADLHDYYAWPYYWLEPSQPMWGPPPVPNFPVPAVPLPKNEGPARSASSGDPHLQSAREVIGYQIQASDGPLGHVGDFVAEDHLWVIRYLVVHSGHVLPRKKVLLSPRWLTEVSYLEQKVQVKLSREKILSGPEFDPRAPVNREYEERLYDYYGQPVYWANEELEKTK